MEQHVEKKGEKRVFGYILVNFFYPLIVAIAAVVVDKYIPDPPPEGSGCVDGGDCENGVGIYRYPNGDTYKGFFRDGKPDGYGELTTANGDTLTGIFENGQHRSSPNQP